MKDTDSEIRRRRLALNLTQKDVAKKVGVSAVTVGYWEHNTNGIKGENLLRLARVLGCSPRDLVDAGGGKDTEDDLLDIEASLITEAYKNSSPEFQEAARRFFGVVLSSGSPAGSAEKD